MLLIADASPLISLMLVKKLDILEKLFPNYIIPEAVWNELNKHNEIKDFEQELKELSKKVQQIKKYGTDSNTINKFTIRTVKSIFTSTAGGRNP